MASDHQYTHTSGTKFKGAHKMTVLEQEVAMALFGAKKAIVGFCGDSSFIGPLFAWLAEPDGKPPKSSNFELIALTSNKQIFTSFNLTSWVLVDKPYYAVGTGAQFALGAMHAGKSAAKAVEYASELDPSSGLGVTEIKI